MPTYANYKDSCQYWIGKIPNKWSLSRLSFLFETISSGTTPSTDAQHYYGGDICWVTTSELREAVIGDTEKKVTEAAIKDFSPLRVYPAGTLLIALYGATIGRLGILGVDACTNQACCAMTKPIGSDVKYVYYTLLAARDHLIFIASGGGQPNINQEKIRALRLPLPTLAEQEAIAAFLDRETGKIDALVAEQERLMALLKEKRQAVISNAVTKGLDPNVPMKHSGIDWLGEVPAHWNLMRLKHISPFIAVGIVVNPSTYVSDDGLPFIYGGDIREGIIDWISSRRISEISSEDNVKTRLLAGDLLTVRVGAPGITAVVPIECEGGNCASVMLIRRGDFASHWLCYAINTRTVRFQVEIVQYGAAQEQFNISHAVNFWVPTPPRGEQDEIVRVLDVENSRFDALTAEATRVIALLKERRAALISAAVTGKIDVRGLLDTKAQAA